MLKYLIAVFVIAFSGCANEGQWVKNDITQQQANQDHYACLQEAQQRNSKTVINAYGGVSRDRVVTNLDLYNACMAARGYTYRQL